MTYNVTLRSGEHTEERTVRASSAEAATADALALAAAVSSETGQEWRVARCDSA